MRLSAIQILLTRLSVTDKESLLLLSVEPVMPIERHFGRGVTLACSSD